MKPTQAQINEELQKLRDLAPRIRQWSAFGDDNRGAIEAQIAILAREKTVDDFEDEDDDDLYTHALIAHDWMTTGELDDCESLSESWEVLA